MTTVSREVLWTISGLAGVGSAVWAHSSGTGLVLGAGLPIGVVATAAWLSTNRGPAAAGALGSLVALGYPTGVAVAYIALPILQSLMGWDGTGSKRDDFLALLAVILGASAFGGVVGLAPVTVGLPSAIGRTGLIGAAAGLVACACAELGPVIWGEPRGVLSEFFAFSFFPLASVLLIDEIRPPGLRAASANSG